MPIDMFIEPEQDPRTEPPTAGSERDTLDLAAERLTSDGRERMSLRWVLNHMIEEYARHNGHADLLRERIDGAVGQ